ncbi:uncharacterized protein MONOS_455 [Monocercomonoides exilis]|uniref:uncharacterized protein n=1 Tax=Monocercomonoides exilis TaxID=2049356 RepID=UPI003559EB24|nr:hypothetical protein MONOS_455 [Monocercomonoides exilis]|eukprot:MONOS_455.1-p1 / transcript=MONOS_455.1 / gene=MONOS_455 / organism=Monocercomonoides_exilis_PA203 / gene_product=unspecified product / transcript_product=unspecified product / location=Mono_scaffold00007:149733-150210(+) / protein_length=120 / sequence_SO=supercontig / SO=protein_coding / is_pseudo=false
MNRKILRTLDINIDNMKDDQIDNIVAALKLHAPVLAMFTKGTSRDKFEIAFSKNLQISRQNSRKVANTLSNPIATEMDLKRMSDDVNRFLSESQTQIRKEVDPIIQCLNQKREPSKEEA